MKLMPKINLKVMLELHKWLRTTSELKNPIPNVEEDDCGKTSTLKNELNMAMKKILKRNIKPLESTE